MALAMRSDARENHDRLVETARQTFAELGPEARVEEIARRAGVGVGTVYRHFPAKADLVRAILEEHIERALDDLDSDAGADALAGFIESIVRLETGDRGVITLMAQSLGPAVRPANLDELFARVWKMIRRGQQEGRLRSDIRRADVPALLRMATAAVDTGADRPSTSDALRRARLLLHGLEA